METQKYCVKWKNRFEHFQTIFADFLEHQVLCDVTLVSEGETFKAHQFVLSGCSSYFRKVFEEVSAGQHPIIFLRDVTSQEVRCLLEYLYKGETVVAKHLMPNFLKTCESLYIQGLCENRTTGTAQDKQRASLKERDHNRNGNLIQASTNAEWFHEYSQESPSIADLTQIDFPTNIDRCVTNNTIQRNVMDSPPHSPESIVFSPGDGIRNLEKTVNDTMESVIVLPERNSEVLEVSDNDSCMNLSCENVDKAKEDAERKYFLESLHLRPLSSCHSDDSLDEFRLVLSPDVLDDETDESEVIFQKRNVNTSGGIDNSANVRLTMTTNMKQIDEGAVQLDDKMRAIQQAERMRVVLSKFPLHPHVYNTGDGTRTPCAVEDMVVSNDESIIDGLGESESENDLSSNTMSYFCSGIYKSIDCVPDNLKHLYCVKCCRCVKSVFWKKHLGIHSAKMRRCLKKKKRI